MQLQVPDIFFWVLTGTALISNTPLRRNIPVVSQLPHLKTQNQLSSQEQCRWYLTLKSFLACLLLRKLNSRRDFVNI